MKRVITIALLACVPAFRSDADEGPPGPPMPYPALPPAVPLPLAIPHTTALPERGRAAVTTPRKQASPPKIRLGEIRKSDHSGGSGPGQTTPANAEVKAGRGKLDLMVTGSVSSHCFFGIPSSSLGSMHVEQEFEVVTDDGGDARVELSLAGKLDGYVRSELRSSASLRLAEAAIAPVGGAPCLWIAFPPSCASGTASERCKGETQSPTMTVAAGHYVLVVNLTLETSAENLLRGHAEAVFAPGRRAGTWTSSVENPFVDVEGEDFGFAVTVKARSPRTQ